MGKAGGLRLPCFLSAVWAFWYTAGRHLCCEPLLFPMPFFSHQAMDILPSSAPQRGFTLVELIMVIVVVGILATFVAPRFFDADIFRSRGFADQVTASLRYAQKSAIAQRRFVCVAFTVDSVTLSTGSTAACGTALQSPTGAASYVINAPANTTFAAVPAAFSFDCLGRPRAMGNAAATCNSGNVVDVLAAAQVINVTGAANGIIIEAETGYVH